ncbi:MAG: hypothetical protein JNL01_06365 [Bdellovibrionales bacterium]|nr:hypothetical protein [Bdellovibrionales bacterium]
MIHEAVRYLAKNHDLFSLRLPIGTSADAYEIAKDHSEKIDALLGIESERIEAELLERAQAIQPDGSVRTYSKALHGEAQTWVGLGAQIVQTPYSEIVEILKARPPVVGEHWVDVGAGYGRLGIVLGCLFEGVQYSGFELVPERLFEGRKVFEKLQLIGTTLFQQDLSLPSFQLPVADLYFIYDYGNLEAIEKSIADIRIAAQSRKITVVARGRASRDTIEQRHPWLATVVAPFHSKNFSIYYTT